jgi:DNA-directed RNA polymerase I, II, and III subunit RPABC2
MSKKSKNNKKEEEDDDYEYDLEEDEVLSDVIDEDDIDEDDINDLEHEPENETVCIMEDINDDEVYYNIEIPTTTDVKYLSDTERISVNRLTKYEMVRILGERTKQITMGAKPLIKNATNLTNEQIVNEEFKNNMIPFKIKRPLPNGKFEIWNLDELKKDHLLSLLE